MCCSICLEEFNKNDNKVVTSCNHVFHKHCLQECMKANLTNCPLCRENILNEPVQCNLKLNPFEQIFDDDDSDDEQPPSPRIKRSFFHRMLYGNKRIH